jgi:hypothetical protein
MKRRSRIPFSRNNPLCCPRNSLCQKLTSKKFSLLRKMTFSSFTNFLRKKSLSPSSEIPSLKKNAPPLPNESPSPKSPPPLFQKFFLLKKNALPSSEIPFSQKIVPSPPQKFPLRKSLSPVSEFP